MNRLPLDSPAPALGRRERKKRETRIALHREALRLFAEKGFQNTRICEIADAADVSSSTFFRYFDTKEGVALEGFRIVAEAVVEAVRNRPVHESPIDACLAVNRDPRIANLRPKAEDLPGFEVLEETPELASKLNLMMNKVLSQLNIDFARRMGASATSLEVRLRAHAVIAASLSSLEAWIDDPTGSDPQALSHEALTQLKSGL